MTFSLRNNIAQVPAGLVTNGKDKIAATRHFGMLLCANILRAPR
jgi:hypothetical protein